MKHIIVGTAGHIDHGKSTLVEALTGTHPDRLEEEKRRGITIDLGFAFLDMEEVRLGFVDVPGHERFVRNMLGGVGGFDLVVLVVAADESVKPQTREHFHICRLLGIPRGLIAITKSDLVEKDVLDLVHLEIEDFVRGSFLEGVPIVSVSARTGAGIEQLKQELLRVARSVPGKDATRPFRLPIDRAFAMKGFGTVVTGTLISGSLKPEAEVELFPARRRVRVRGLHSGGHAVQEAFAGQRTAVNLASIELEEIHRGMTLAAPGIFQTTRRLDARITLIPSTGPLRHRARVHFHQGTCEAIAEVALLEGSTLAPGQSALVQLQLDQAALLIPGDRFILRQFSPVVTIGGGVVIDALAPRHRQREKNLPSFLSTIERGSRGEILAALLAVETKGLTLQQVLARTGWKESEARETAAQLQNSRELRIIEKQPLIVVSAKAMAACVDAVRREVERFHKSNPLVPGISKEQLRGQIGTVRPELFRAALEELVQAGVIAISGDAVRLAGREIALSASEAKAKEQIEQEFERAGLAVPRCQDVLAKLPLESQHARKILQILLREKVLIKVTEDLVFHHKAMTRLRELLSTYRQQRGERLPIPVFKELTGISRKYAIPLLEYLDRERVTRRVGDERVIL